MKNQSQDDYLNKANEMVDLLQNIPGSFFSEFLNMDQPLNDEQYMKMWRLYFHAITLSDFKTDRFTGRYSVHYSRLETANEVIEVRTKIRKICDIRLKEFVDKLEFEPRIITYLKTIETSNKWDLTLCTMYLLTFNDESENYQKLNTLWDIQRAIGLDYHWTLNLNEKHKLFVDGLLSTKRSKSERPFIVDDLYVSPELHRFFWGIKIDTNEIIDIKSSFIPDLFGISVDLSTDEYEVNSKVMEDVPDLGEFLSLTKDSGHKLESDMNNNEVFSNNLDFLEHQSRWISESQKLAVSSSGLFRSIRDDEEREASRKEIKRLKKEGEVKLAKTIENGFRPDLIKAKEYYGLNNAEIDVLKVLLIAQKPSFFDLDDTFFRGISINHVITILYETVEERFKAQELFWDDSRLVRNQLIHVDKTGNEYDPLKFEVSMDIHLSSLLIGEEFKIRNHIEGGKLGPPKYKWEDVILDGKEDVIERFIHHDTIRKARKELVKPTLLDQKDSKMYLFVGPPGSGKTLTAHGIASRVEKNISIVNPEFLFEKMYDKDRKERLFPMLFREAANKNAILFFDESEQLLKHRLNDLLICSQLYDIEVIFATNAEFEIDEALRSRIRNNVVYFKEPGPEARFKIIKKHLPLNIEVPGDEELKEVAMQTKLTGREIKDAINTAIDFQVIADGSCKIDKLELQHLERAIKAQRGNKVFNTKLKKTYTPSHGLDYGVFDSKTREQLEQVARNYNLRKTLQSEWGFDKDDDIKALNTKRVILLHGEPGTGKTFTAGMIAHEVGQDVQQVNVAEIINKYVGETEKNIQKVLNDVCEPDAVLLFDEADSLFSKRTDVNNSHDKFSNSLINILLQELERVENLIIITTNHLDLIDKALPERMTTIELKKPNATLRKQLWKQLIPDKVPLSEDIDFAVLAKKFSGFSGRDIKKSIVDACFQEAGKLGADKIITMEKLITAAEAIAGDSEATRIGY